MRINSPKKQTMQENQLYEYAVLRVVPRQLSTLKIAELDAEADIERIEMNLSSFEKICQGKSNGGQIASMDLASRFRWLTAVRSSVIQTSRPHPGLSKDLSKTLQELFEEYVL